MIAPPVFKLCAASPAVRQALGTDPVRVFPFGQAAQGVTYPYCVWQVIDGSPLHYLSDSPDVDFFTAQIDIYGQTGQAVREAATAVRDAIEPTADITRWGGESVDPTTQNYRISFDTRWGTRRDS